MIRSHDGFYFYLIDMAYYCELEERDTDRKEEKTTRTGNRTIGNQEYGVGNFVSPIGNTVEVRDERKTTEPEGHGNCFPTHSGTSIGSRGDGNELEGATIIVRRIATP